LASDWRAQNGSIQAVQIQNRTGPLKDIVIREGTRCKHVWQSKECKLMNGMNVMNMTETQNR
jgi:hypothetical protein